MDANYKLVYHGNKENLPDADSRVANSFYLTDDSLELYFGANKYGKAVRTYTTASGKPTAPAEDVLYINTDTGVGEAYNGTAWVVVIKGYATTIGDAADDTTVPTSRAVKDYVDGKTNGTATDEALTALGGRVTTLEGGDAGKSVRIISTEEATKAINTFATQVSNDGVVNSFKELVDWAATHGPEAAEMSAAIQAIQTVLDGIGGEGEKPTVVAYVSDAVAALKIGDYAKAADLTALAARVATVEEKAHEHTNKTELDKFVDGDKARLDAVVAALTVGTF